ncbi:hypothetical protein [Flindersiella endophytica]
MAGRTNTEEDSVSEPTSGRGTGIKTLALRLPDAIHARFALVAQVEDLSLADAGLKAVELYVAQKQQEGDFAAKAQAIVDEIEREAEARRSAIQGLFGASDQDDATPLSKGRAKRHPSGQAE